MADQERLQREATFASALFGLFVSLLFTLPLLADPIARALGFYVFFLMDPYTQLVWAAIVQIWPGWTLYRASAAAVRQRRFAPALLAAPISLGLFAYSVAQSFDRDSGPALYLASAGVITLYHLGWSLAIIFGFPRRSTPTI